ncbi:MAG: hypothetical protein D6748_06935, partial [Calditrichaeota bacterium]
MESFKSQVILFILLSAVFSCFGQGNNVSSQPIEPQIPFDEHWTEEIPHSGGIRIGLMTHYDKGKIDPSLFFVRIPDGEFTNLCCDIKSRDGRYSASLKYDISDLKPGLYSFKLPSNYHSKLENYQSKDIVILAALGKNCSKNPSYYIPASWDSTKALPETATAADTVYILLLSEADITFIEVFNTKTRKSKQCDCLKINTNTSRAYN